MNKNLLFSRFLVCMSLMLLCSLFDTSNIYAQKQSEGNNNTIKVKSDVNPTLDAVLAVLVKAFEEYRTKEEGEPFSMKAASVDLNTVTGTDTSGTVKILVFSFGGGKSVENSSTLNIKLSAPESLVKKKDSSIINPDELKALISKNIAMARNAILEAKIGDLDAEMTYELKFTVTTKYEGGVVVPILTPIEIGAKRSKKNTQVHTIKLIFGQ